ncbi:MAG: hypothetical protein NZ551_01925 [Microscillaceae bacterium]|nr:hypothetical protein [Microscillaceae bacterium]MDW8459945.1 hypothetical protein [Cytophagales bacterium]
MCIFHKIEACLMEVVTKIEVWADLAISKIPILYAENLQGISGKTNPYFLECTNSIYHILRMY